MFSLKDFIKKGLMDAVGKLADYQVILNAAGWHDKGVLTTDDLADIQAAIDVQKAVEEGPGAGAEEDAAGDVSSEGIIGEDASSEAAIENDASSEEIIEETGA